VTLFEKGLGSHFNHPGESAFRLFYAAIAGHCQPGDERHLSALPAAGHAQKCANGKLSDMQGGFLIRHSRLTALGILLCVLAALFAVEAKIAWFSPAGSATALISNDKACPVEPPKAHHHRFSAPAPQGHDIAGTAMLFDAVILSAALATVVVRPAPFHSRVSASPGFTAARFVRPPPIL